MLGPISKLLRKSSPTGTQKRAGQRSVLISTMRDEGPFVLEWLAYHRSIGFDRIIVATNGCTDGSDRLLAALSTRGFVDHLPCDPPPGAYPPKFAYARARALPAVEDADWVMILDADEFLVVHVGDGRVQDLLERAGDRAIGLGIHWKCFGDNDIKRWEDGYVRLQYTQAAPREAPANKRFKSIFTEHNRFETFAPHAPSGFDGDWGGRNVWVNASGAVMPGCRLVGEGRARATAEKRISHEWAQVNHYVMKAQDCMAMRRARWSDTPVETRYDEEFIARYNINEEEDETALFRYENFQQEYERLTADRDILRLHHECCTRFAIKLARFSGHDPRLDDRVRHHMNFWTPPSREELFRVPDAKPDMAQGSTS